MEKNLISEFENKCRQSFINLRWQYKRKYCPRCKYKRKIYSLGDGRFKCSRCGFKFQDFIYTYLQALRIPFTDIVRSIHLFISDVPWYRYNSENISLRGDQKNYPLIPNISLKTVQKVYTLIRQAIYDSLIKWLKEIDKIEGIKINETVCSGEDWKTANEYLVFGLHQQYEEVVTFLALKTDSLIHSVPQHVKPGSVYYLDDHLAYVWLPVRNGHVIVNKGKNKTKGNTIIENFWNYARNHFKRRIPLHYFHLYLKEAEFRFNNREEKEEDLFLLIANLLVNPVPDYR